MLDLLIEMLIAKFQMYIAEFLSDTRMCSLCTIYYMDNREKFKYLNNLLAATLERYLKHCYRCGIIPSNDTNFFIERVNIMVLPFTKRSSSNLY